jgi:hypothetical protein
MSECKLSSKPVLLFATLKGPCAPLMTELEPEGRLRKVEPFSLLPIPNVSHCRIEVGINPASDDKNGWHLRPC